MIDLKSKALLNHVRVKEFLGDSGYDGENVYQLLKTRGIKPIIKPPNSSQIITFNEIQTAREKSIKHQQIKGFEAWRVKHKYSREKRQKILFIISRLFLVANSYQEIIKT